MINLDAIETTAERVNAGFQRFTNGEKPTSEDVREIEELHQLLMPMTVLALVEATRTMDRLAEAVGTLKRSAKFWEPETDGEARLLATALEVVESALQDATTLWDEYFVDD